MTRQEPEAFQKRTLLPLTTLMLCALLWPALLTFDIGDPPSPHQFPPNDPCANTCGPIGAWLAYQFRYLVGDAAYPLLLFATLAAMTTLIRGQVGQLWERLLGLVLVVPCTAAAVHLIGGPAGGAVPLLRGGLVGFALGELLETHLSRLGTLIVLGSCVFVGLVFATQGWVLRLPAAVRRAIETSGHALANAYGLVGRLAGLRPAHVPAGQRGSRSPAARRAGPDRSPRSRRRTKPTDQQPEDEHDPSELDDDAADAGDADEGEVEQSDAEIQDDEQDAAAAKPLSRKARAAARRAAKGAIGPKVNFPTAARAQTIEPYPRQIENWTLPSLSRLEKPAYGFTAEQEVAVREQAKTLERTLEEFRLDASVVEIDTGPVITLFELRLGAGIKVSQIASLSNDMARALRATAIRVVAPIPGKNTVGIEVPNQLKETVRLRDLLVSAQAKAKKMALPLFLGKDAGGAPLVVDLTAMPHLLIAGTTGSGKSVCINAIIMSLLMTKRPDHVKMILVDPKMVELSQFKNVPHLMCPIITDVARAERILEWAVTKMDERYELLAEARVRNVSAYNELSEAERIERFKPATDREKALIPANLPYIVIIIDELADLMMTSAKEVEHHLSRLAQKSRSVGIHIIVATQRPEAKVVTGLIKSNLPCRIAFRVASRMDSRIVLDQNGGEVLMGRGDMLFLAPGTHKLLRAQGTYLSDSELQGVLDDLASRSKPDFHPELVKIKSAGSDGGAGLRDPLFNNAVKMVIDSGRGSVSLLQRRLTIGYSRASRLVEQMADAGIVGAYKGSQAREVLVTAQEWAAIRAQVARDEAAGYEADEDDENSNDTDGEDDSA